MEAITTPRQWIKNIDKVITEYKAVCKMLENSILNDRYFTQKEMEKFVAFSISIDKLEIMDFYESLDNEPADKRNGKYQDFNYQLNQTLKNLHEHKFPEAKKELHDFNVMDLQRAYQKVWSLVMNRLFELKNFYNCFLNPDFEGIDSETGKYIFKKKHTWNINPNDPAESIRDFFYAFNHYFINLSNKLKYKMEAMNAKDLFDYGEVGMLIVRSKVELETFITCHIGGIQFLNKHISEVDELMNRRASIIKEFKLNHVDILPKNIDYFDNTQLLCEYYDWLKFKIIPHYKQTDDKKVEIQNPTLAELSTHENKFRKLIDMNFVINHFSVFSSTKSTNGKLFMSNEVFVAFLKRSFLNEPKIGKLKINHAQGEKGFVISRFYDFYILAVQDYCELAKKADYIKLVHENFSNLGDYNSIKSFFKPNKSKRKW